MGARRYLPQVLVTLVLTVVSLASIAVGVPSWLSSAPVAIRVGAGCAPPKAVAGNRVEVVLADMGHMMGGPMMGGRRMMLMPSRPAVPAGTVTFVAVNHGLRLHELVVLPLGQGARAGQRHIRADRAVDESASLGEASRSCGAGAGAGIRPGDIGWVTMRLAPGRYELVCNRPGHYAAGMFAELGVT